MSHAQAAISYNTAASTAALSTKSFSTIADYRVSILGKSGMDKPLTKKSNLFMANTADASVSPQFCSAVFIPSKQTVADTTTTTSMQQNSEADRSIKKLSDENSADVSASFSLPLPPISLSESTDVGSLEIEGQKSFSSMQQQGAANGWVHDLHRQRKFKFREAEPQVVSTEDFNLLNRALRLQQTKVVESAASSTSRRSSCHCDGISTKKTAIATPSSTTTSFSTQSSSDYLSNGSLMLCAFCKRNLFPNNKGNQEYQIQDVCSSRRRHEDAEIESEFVAWLDSSLASTPSVVPPVLTFAKEEKGQPVTVVFYHRDTKHCDAKSKNATTTTTLHPSNDGGPLLEEPKRRIMDIELKDNKTTTTTTQNKNNNSIIKIEDDVLPYEKMSSTTCSAPTSFLCRGKCLTCSRLTDHTSIQEEGGKPSSTLSAVVTSKVTLKFSAGVSLIRRRRLNIEGMSQIISEVLVIRRGEEKFYELPKGHLEKNESFAEAAKRELIEETGIQNPIQIDVPVLSERYVVTKSSTERLEKSVHYFKAYLLPFKGKIEKNNEGIFVDDNNNNNKPIIDQEVCSSSVTLSGEQSAHTNFQQQQQSDTNNNNLSRNDSWLSDDSDIVLGHREAQTRELKWVHLAEIKTIFWKSDAVETVVYSSLISEK